MLVTIKIYEIDNNDKYVTLENDADKDAVVYVNCNDAHVKVSIEELKLALRKISCK